MSRIQGITIKLQGDTSALQASLNEVYKKSTDLNKELRQINTSLKFHPGNADLIAQKQRVLKEAIEASRRKLDELKEAQRLAAAELAKGNYDQGEYDKLTREILKTEDQLKSLQKELGSVESKWTTAGTKIESAGKKITKAGDSVGKAGKTLSTRVTAPVVALGTLAGKAAIDFESAFAGVRKTVNASEAEFAMLEEGIRSMAKELPASAAEIAGVAEAAGQLGIKTENILGFTRVMIDLGESTNMSAEEAATALARLANITGMPQTEFDKLGSVIVDLGNNFATTEKEIVDMGLRLAGAGAQVGMTEAEVMAFAAALSSVGIEAQAGGSAFSKVMVEMQLATETGGQKLEDFAAVAGMSADEFKTAFQEDAAGAIIAFVGGLSSAEERGQSAIGILDEMGITEVRLRDALLRASGASDVFSDAIATGTTAWEENTALTQEAEERYKTMESRLEILKNNFIDVAISIGEQLMPHVEKFVNWLGNLADKLSEVNPETMDMAIKIAAVVAAIGPFLMILGPLLKVIGGVVTGIGIFSQAIGVLTAGAAAATPIVAGVAKVITLLTNPIFLVGAAIAALAAIFIANWDHIKEYTIAAWQAISGFLTEAWSSFIAMVQPIWDTLIAVFTVIWMTIQEIFRAGWAVIEAALTVAWQLLANTATAIFQTIQRVFETVWNAIKSVTESVWNAIWGFISPIWERVKSAASTIFNAIKSAIETVWNAIRSTTQSVWNAIWGVLSPIWERIKSGASAIFNAIRTAIETVWNAVRDTSTSVWNGIASTLTSIWNGVKSTVSSVFESIKSTITSIWDSVKSATTNAWNAVKSAIEGPINRARDIVKSAIDRIKSFLNITLPFPKIKLPHFSISGRFSLNPPQIPKFGVQWYDKGGIFRGPSIIGVGEKRPEFVGALDDLKAIVAEVIEKKGSGGEGIVITGNTFAVREEADIRKIAQELMRLADRQKRGGS